ncbi:metal-dependent transcriptional regulator [Halorussus salinisoli]|uniref:metal-dependent transcriptional regulator n=1 Tax=Halorussus salinisoli TaxID=2558242 RepID=UPI0010C1D2CA|nr:metal-dependent transcriptional regulator [Halorussus salinisoli]
MTEVSESVGRYLSTIYLLTADADRRAQTSELAELLDVSAASVTGMVTSLDDRGLVTYEKYEGVRLTDDGTEAAREFTWRRCVTENFLEDDLGLDLAVLRDDDVADDPLAIGQALSDEAVHRLKDLVDHPCDGKCSGPSAEYDSCIDDVRETPGDADAES